MTMTDKIAVVRIRGIRNMKPRLKRTFELLRLERPNHCVVIESSPQNMGMLNIVKDYVTFGKVSGGTLTSLEAKRGKKAVPEKGSAKPAAEVRKPVYRLHPPKGGMKDIKLPWPMGVLGARDNMDAFLKKMI
jgi:large subunit ribosomal protein L30